VFITIETMDIISLKLIDRNVMKQELLKTSEIISNLKNQNNELFSLVELHKNKGNDLKFLYGISEEQKNIALENYENQVIITKNVKKKPLKTDFYISGAEFRSVWSPLYC
jgi:hypothetical protein